MFYFKRVFFGGSFADYPNLDFNQTRQRRSDYTALAYNAYIGLEKLCKKLHGNVLANQLPLIFRTLLPGILMNHRGSSEIAPRGLAVIRDHTLHFVKHLMAVVRHDPFTQVFYSLFKNSI